MTIANWRFLSDPYFNELFVVLPLTGSLISISSSSATIQIHGFWIRLLGLHINKLRDEQFFAKKSIIDLPPGATLPNSYDRRSKIILIFVKYSLMLLPLGFVVRIVEIFTSMHIDRKHKFTRTELELVSSAFGRRSKDDCLQMAICRYALLRLLGVESTVCIGVLVPTEEMHAWVEVDGHPILECSDVLVHYQTCLKFSGSSPK